MNDSSPDYSQYSVAQLQELASGSNREHNPLLWQIAHDELARRALIPPLASPDGSLSQPPLQQSTLFLRIVVGIFLGPFIYTLFVVAIQGAFIPEILRDIYKGIVAMTLLLGIIWGAYVGARLPEIRQSPTWHEPKLWKGTFVCLALFVVLYLLTGEPDILLLLSTFGTLPLSIVWGEYVVRANRV